MTIPTPTAWGAETLVNGAVSGNQSDSLVFTLADGRYIVVYTDYGSADVGDIRARVFNADGTVAIADFAVSTGIGGRQGDPTVTQVADGRVVVAWFDDSTNNIELTSISLGANTAVVAPPVTVVTANALVRQSEPSLARLGNIGFVLNYSDDGDNGRPPSQDNAIDIREIVFQFAAGDSSPVAGSTGVVVSSALSPQGGTTQNQSDTATLANGDVVTVWRDARYNAALGGATPNAGTTIRGVITSSAGVLGADFIINTFVDPFDYAPGFNGVGNVQVNEPTVAALAGGGFAVFWEAHNPQNAVAEPGEIRGRFYNAAGTALNASDFVVNTSSAGLQHIPVAAGLPDGNVVLVWADRGNNGAGGFETIRARVYSPDGSDSSIEFPITTQATTNTNAVPGTNIEITSVSGLLDGRFVVTWTDASGTLGDTNMAVHSQIFDARTGRAVWVGTAASEVYYGTNFAPAPNGVFPTGDDLRSAGGNDTLWGMGGDDYLQAGAGANVVHGGSGTDMLSFYDLLTNVNFTLDASGAGTFNAPDGSSFTYDSIESVAGSDYGFLQGNNTALGADTLTGNGGANVLLGFWGNDSLSGLGGSDTLGGGEGNDILNGGLGDDQLAGDTDNDTILAATSDGNDTITGGNGFDVLDFSAVGGVVQINQFAGTVTGSAGNDTLTDVIEQVIGSNFNDVLAGGNGINILDGNGGNDQLYGNGGQDLLRGGAGNDTFYASVNDGNDTLLGGDGFDVLDFSTLPGVVQVNQFAGTTTGTANNDTLQDVFEQVIGSAFGDVLAGGNGINGLIGGGGNDSLFGNGGQDYLRGGTGNDEITMGTGDDTLDMRAGDQLETILDFVAGGTEDSVNLHNYAGLGIANFAALQASGRLSTVSGHAELALNGGDKIIFQNVASHTSLSAADFTF